MPVEVVSFLFSEENQRSGLQFQMIFQCAPFLKRMKASCMLNVDPGYCRDFEDVLRGTDMEYEILSENEEKCLVFLYRREELAVVLEKKEAREFLGRYGYSCRSLKEALGRLSQRVQSHAGRDKCFPHEIGVFLDYPVEDVRCFIEQGGKGEAVSGYWKAYQNPRKAQLVFQAYDKARVSAVNEYLAGRTIREIAGSPSFFYV